MSLYFKPLIILIFFLFYLVISLPPCLHAMYAVLSSKLSFTTSHLISFIITMRYICTVIRSKLSFYNITFDLFHNNGHDNSTHISM